LRVVDHAAWPAAATVGRAFAAASPLRRIGALAVAGVVTTVVRLLLRRSREDPASVLTMLWEQAGIISLGKTVARSLLAVVDVGLGAALGLQGPPCPCLVGTTIADRLLVEQGWHAFERRFIERTRVKVFDFSREQPIVIRHGRDDAIGSRSHTRRPRGSDGGARTATGGRARRSAGPSGGGRHHAD